MGLLAKLQSGDSVLGYNGEVPPTNTVAGANDPSVFFAGSQLDLDGETPTTYADTAPEGQGGKV
tara:strand:+ start:157 stop:348 length:192 start_codon:yes stop_codon:yes gene_type:complete